MTNELTTRPDHGEAAIVVDEGGEIVTSGAATPQEMRTIEVSRALEPAYQRASMLEISDEELKLLMEPFPDSAVEIRAHDGLIYIPHIEISNRLNRVFRPGQWAMIRRREWFALGVMYGEYVLVIRGCYVGEAVGGHPYITNNPKTNYSDALEATRSEALKRIAGKTLSCGDQVWKPEYSRQWVAKNAEQVRNNQGKMVWQRKANIGGNGTPPPRQEAAKPAAAAPAKPDQFPKMILKMPPERWEEIKAAAKAGDCSQRKILNEYGVSKPSDLIETVYADCIQRIKDRDPRFLNDKPAKSSSPASNGGGNLADELYRLISELDIADADLIEAAAAVGVMSVPKKLEELSDGQQRLLLAKLQSIARV